METVPVFGADFALIRGESPATFLFDSAKASNITDGFYWWFHRHLSTFYKYKQRYVPSNPTRGAVLKLLALSRPAIAFCTQIKLFRSIALHP